MQSFGFKGADNLRLVGREWRSESKSALDASFKGTIFGCHGYTEHSGRYQEFADLANQQGFNVALFDLPGHGLSEGRRSDIARFGDYVLSLELFFEEVQKRNLLGPYYLFGHSLGGLICIRFLQVTTKTNLIAKAALVCPLLGLSPYSFHGVGKLVQSRWGAKFLKFLCTIVPNFTLPNKGESGLNVLTHDEAMIKERALDPLIRPSVTVRWTREFLDAVERAFKDENRISTSLAIFQAGDDRVVSVTAPRKFYELLKVKDKKFVEYPDMWHELLHEVNRVQVRADILDWFGEPASGSTG